MENLLTICILTYNRPDYLSECLGSVLAQTFPDFRVVILDNASELDYSDVLERFTDQRIIYRRHEINLGGESNFMIALSEYSDLKYLMVFHDDDLMHPKLVEHEIGLLEQNDNVVFVATAMHLFQKPLAKFPDTRESPDVKFYSKHELAELLLNGFPLHFGSSMYRSGSLVGHKLDYKRYSKICDRPFILEVLKNDKRCAVIHEPLVLYRVHPGQDSQVGELSDGHIIELYRAYRVALKGHWGLRTAWLFYKSAGQELLDSYWRISPEHRDHLFRFLRKCREAGILQYPFLIFYVLRFTRLILSSARRELKHLT